MIKIHPSAEVSKRSVVGEGTSIWNQSQIRENAKVGKDCIVGKNVYIDTNVIIGNRVKIQNNVSLFQGVELEDGVFVGPHVSFTNDKKPRAINPDGSLKKNNDWELTKTLVKKGASIGANSTILPGLVVGSFAMVGAGSVVTKNVPDHALVYGNPAKLRGYVCYCASKISKTKIKTCSKCKGKILK